MRSKIVRVTVWSVVLVGIIAATVYSLRPQPIFVDVAEVKRGPLSVFVQDDGITRIRERYVVSTPLTGRLLRISYDVGDMVAANETVLARMQPTDPDLLDPRALAQAKARVSAAQRRLEATRAELAKAEAALSFAEVELGRMRRLREKSAVSETELDEAELLYRSRMEEVRAAGFNVEIAEYELQLQRAALLLTDPARQASKTPLVTETPDDSDAIASETITREGDSTENDVNASVADMELAIVAPIDGRILRIYQESTAVISAGSALMEIGDPTDLEIVVDVLSRDAVQIHPGDPVVMENWGQPEPLRGRVRRIEPSGFTKTSALGVEEQRVNVIIDLAVPIEQRRSLGDNFRVDARIIIWQDDNVLQVPTSALFRLGDQWSVFRVVQGIAESTAVEVGQNNGIAAQVIRGLTAGDIVITHPGDSISDGTLVKNRSRQ